ncbi:hypothetical protein ACROYT_G027856 [Oculina patagonica]
MVVEVALKQGCMALVIFQWLDLERIVMQVALVVLTVLVVDCCCCVGAGGSEAGDTCSVSGCGEAGDNETGGVDGASGRFDGDGDVSRTSGTCTARGDCGGGAKSCGSSCWRCQLKIVVCKLQTAVELVALVVQVVDCGGNGARSSEAGVLVVLAKVVLIVEVARIIVQVELVVVCGNGGAGAGSSRSSGGRGDSDAGGVNGGLLVVLVLSDGN